MSPTCILSLNLKNIIFFQKRGKENRSLVHDYWLIGLVGWWVGGWVVAGVIFVTILSLPTKTVSYKKKKKIETKTKTKTVSNSNIAQTQWRRLLCQKCHVASRCSVDCQLSRFTQHTFWFYPFHCLTQPQSTKTKTGPNNITSFVLGFNGFLFSLFLAI